MKKVSVIVPCYNMSKYLDKCVESFLHQTIGIENIEIILVDDASDDEGETKRTIKEYEKRFPETVMAIFLEQNMRQGGARNIGIIYASGEYLTFCDADDWVLEETLERCYRIAKEYDVDIVEFDKKKVYTRNGSCELEKGKKSMLLETDTDKQKKEILLNTFRGPGDNGSQYTLFRTSLIKDNHIAFVEHTFMEEPPFVYPAKLYAKRYYYLDERLYFYYQSPKSTVRNSDWESRKWDNWQSWVFLMNDLEARGLLQYYREEMGFLFFEMGFGHSIQLVFQKNCAMAREEWEIITDTVNKLIPDIRQNMYIKNESEPFNQAWNGLLLRLLDMRFTEESTREANQSLAACIKALWACPIFH